MANRFNGEYRLPHEGGSVFRPYAPKNPHQQEQMFPQTRPYSDRENGDYPDPHKKSMEKPKKYEYPNKSHQEDSWTQPRPSKGHNFGPKKDDKSPHENVKTHKFPVTDNGPHTVDPHENEYYKRRTPPNYNEPPKKGGSEGPKKDGPYKDPDGGSSVTRKPKPKTPNYSGGLSLPIAQKVK